jgi:hypothetical protein
MPLTQTHASTTKQFTVTFKVSTETNSSSNFTHNHKHTRTIARTAVVEVRQFVLDCLSCARFERECQGAHMEAVIAVYVSVHPLAHSECMRAKAWLAVTVWLRLARLPPPASRHLCELSFAHYAGSLVCVCVSVCLSMRVWSCVCDAVHCLARASCTMRECKPSCAPTVL